MLPKAGAQLGFSEMNRLLVNWFLGSCADLWLLFLPFLFLQVNQRHFLL